MSKKVNIQETVNDLYRWQEQGENRVFMCIAGDLDKNHGHIESAGKYGMLYGITLLLLMESPELKALFVSIAKLFTRLEGNGLYDKMQDWIDEEKAEEVIRQVLEEEGKD